LGTQVLRMSGAERTAALSAKILRAQPHREGGSFSQ